MNFNDYFNITNKNCSIIVEKEENVSIIEILDYIFCLIKLEKVDTFVFSGYNKIIEKIINGLYLFPNFQDNCQTILLDFGDIKNEHKLKFYNIINCRNQKNNKNLVTSSFSEYIIYIPSSIDVNLITSLSNSYKVLKIF